jgi:hypothetical protein
MTAPPEWLLSGAVGYGGRTLAPRFRDQPERPSPSACPQLVEMRAGYADVDRFQPLNNVALARFFEEGRWVTLGDATAFDLDGKGAELPPATRQTNLIPTDQKVCNTAALGPPA